MKVQRLKTDPTKLIENDHIWSSLSSDQKETILVDGAKAEIDKVLNLFAANKIDINQTRNLVMKLTMVTIEG